MENAESYGDLDVSPDGGEGRYSVAHEVDHEDTETQGRKVAKPFGPSASLDSGGSYVKRVFNKFSKKGRLYSWNSSTAEDSIDPAIGLVILANSVTLGLDQSLRLQGTVSPVIAVMEHGFLVIYVVELSLRFLAFSYHCLSDNWVKFDTFLVICGVLTNWIIEPTVGDIEGMGLLLVLRLARLLRLARAVRLLVKFRELWMLVRGFQSSAGTMFYTLVMLTMVLYIFGCMGVELITNHNLAKGPEVDPIFEEQVERYFRNLPITMLTLVQFVTLDNMNVVYREFVQRDFLLGLYFLALLLIVSIVLMNLITAVLVNSALEQALQDKDAMKAEELKKKKRLMKRLRDIFVRLDEDQSGEITDDEILQMTDDDKQLFFSVMGMSDPMEVFHAIDVDHSGGLDLDEFCDGIWAAAISKTPIEMRRLEKQVMNIHDKMMMDKGNTHHHYHSTDMVSRRSMGGSLHHEIKMPEWARNMVNEIQDLKVTVSELTGSLRGSKSRGPRSDGRRPPCSHAEWTTNCDLPVWVLQLSSQMCQEVESFRSQMQEAVSQLQLRLGERTHDGLLPDRSDLGQELPAEDARGSTRESSTRQVLLPDVPKMDFLHLVSPQDSSGERVDRQPGAYFNRRPGSVSFADAEQSNEKSKGSNTEIRSKLQQNIGDEGEEHPITPTDLSRNSPMTTV